MISCHSHSERAAAGTCRSCGHAHCEECLVYAFGEGKAPFCIDCAVSASTHNGWEDRRRVVVPAPLVK